MVQNKQFLKNDEKSDSDSDSGVVVITPLIQTHSVKRHGVLGVGRLLGVIFGSELVVLAGDASHGGEQLRPLRLLGQGLYEVEDPGRRAERVAPRVALHAPQLVHDVEVVRDAVLVSRRLVRVEVEALAEPTPDDCADAHAARLVRREEDGVWRRVVGYTYTFISKFICRYNTMQYNTLIFVRIYFEWLKFEI